MLESASRGGAWSGGVPGPGGVCSGGAWSGGVYVCSGGVLVWGVSAPGGVPGPGGCLVWGGSAPGGVSQHALRQTPLPPCGQTDTCENITLAQLRCGR